METDKEALSKIYSSLPDDQIKSYILNHKKDFTHEALKLLKDEVERRDLSPGLKKEIELQLTKGLEPSQRKTFLKLWLYPLINLVLVIIYTCLMKYSSSAHTDYADFLFLLLMIILFLTIAGIITLAKGSHLFIITKNRNARGITKKLVAGLVLNCAVVAIPTYMYIDSYMYRLERERQYKTVIQIKNIKMALILFLNDYGAYPSESQGVGALRTIDPQAPANDPWGRPYGYRLKKSPGTNALEPYVWSNGPDGISGTADDIDENTLAYPPPKYHWPAA